MRKNKRVRMLVDYAKAQKIMEPFAKTMKMKTDSVDRHGKDGKCAIKVSSYLNLKLLNIDLLTFGVIVIN